MVPMAMLWQTMTEDERQSWRDWDRYWGLISKGSGS